MIQSGKLQVRWWPQYLHELDITTVNQKFIKELWFTQHFNSLFNKYIYRHLDIQTIKYSNLRHSNIPFRMILFHAKTSYSLFHIQRFYQKKKNSINSWKSNFIMSFYKNILKVLKPSNN